MYERYKLDNGIKVVTEYIPYVNSISLGVWIGSGSRYENEQNNGVSHFIEHMLFKGTQNKTAKQIAEKIEGLGGQINAFTGKEATCFYVKMLDSHINIGIDVLSDMIINSKLDENEIIKERSVIQEEINMYEDSPEDLVFDLLSKVTWKEDSLAFPILGSQNTIKSLNREVIMEYFNKMYVPDNMVISIAGNFDKESLLDMLNSKFGVWNPNRSFNMQLSKPNITRDIMVKNKDIEQTHVAITLQGIELGNDKLYTLLAINNYFGGGTSSVLFQKLREERGYVYTVYSYPSAYVNNGVFSIYLALNDNYIEDAMELIHEEVRKINSNKMSNEEINNAKEQLKGNYILGLESISSRMFSIGKSELMLGRVYEPKEILAKIDKITKDGVDEVMDLVFNKGFKSLSLVSRSITKEKISSLMRK